MMREMQALFGEEFWQYTVLGVSHWPFDANSVAERNFTGKTEKFFMEKWKILLQDKFHIDLNLTGVFIDSWSQQPWNLADQDQQIAFQRETGKLWNFAKNHEQFQFRTVEDVLEENLQLKAEIKWLNDVITNNISEIMKNLERQSEDIELLKEEDTNIKVNVGVLFDLHDNLQSQHETDLTDVNAQIDENERNLQNLEKTQEPLGTIIAWVPKVDKNSNSGISEIPECWMLCNGSKITEGIWTDLNTPNLNGDGRFLRGGQPQDILMFQEDTLQDHDHSLLDSGHAHTDAGHTHSDSGHAHNYDDIEEIWHSQSNYKYNEHGGFEEMVTKSFQTKLGQANIQSSSANIQSATTNIKVEKVQNARKSEETRPKNAIIQWIIRVC